MAGTCRVGVLLIALVTLVVGVSLVLPLVVGISLVAGIPLDEVLLLLNGWPCLSLGLRKRMRLILIVRFDKFQKAV